MYSRSKLVFVDLNKDSVVTQLRKLNWQDPVIETVIINCLVDVRPAPRRNFASLL